MECEKEESPSKGKQERANLDEVDKLVHEYFDFVAFNFLGTALEQKGAGICIEKVRPSLATNGHRGKKKEKS